jgi:hypothetical protein
MSENDRPPMLRFQSLAKPCRTAALGRNRQFVIRQFEGRSCRLKMCGKGLLHLASSHLVWPSKCAMSEGIAQALIDRRAAG